jgi:hypothetical protein
MSIFACVVTAFAVTLVGVFVWWILAPKTAFWG